MEENSYGSLKELVESQYKEIQQYKKILSLLQIDNHKSDIKNFEIICLKCKQLVSNESIINDEHTVCRKDHIDYFLHINEIKKQLSDINSNNNNESNNNIFQKRIETLWSELIRLSTSFSDLDGNQKEITDHFKIYYDFLMSQERLLKKKISDQIDLVKTDILNHVQELKSIVNLQNINNNNSNTDSYDDDIINHTEDTTEKYEVPNIVKSILQTNSINKFVEENNSTLFYYNKINNIKEAKNNNLSLINLVDNYNKEFETSLLNPTSINSLSKDINKNHFSIKINENNICQNLQKLIQETITISRLPSSVLLLIEDFEGLVDYYKIKDNNNNNRKTIDIKKSIIDLLKSNRLDILEHLFLDLQLDVQNNFEKKDLNLSSFSNFIRIKYMNILLLAIKYSNLETIQFIDSLGVKNNIEWDYIQCLEISPLSNNIKVLQYFSLKVLQMNLGQLDQIIVSGYAAFLGRTDMLDWISKNTPFKFSYVLADNNTLQRYFAIDIAAINGQSDAVRYLSNRNESRTDTMDYAATYGHLEIVEWLHSNRSEGCTTNAMDGAALNGQLQTIIWLHENRTEGCTTKAIDNASEKGHIEIVKWLHHNRTEGCTTNAMDCGNLEIVKWLHENRTEGCTKNAMDNAAQKGDLDKLIWLHNNRTEGCTTEAMDYAAWHGHFKTLIWLHENRTEGCTTKALDNAVLGCSTLNGNIDIIKWLHENRTEGCTFKAMDYAAFIGHLEVLNWFHNNRTEGCTANAINAAAQNGHLEVIKWFHNNRTEGFTTYAMDFAAMHGQLELVKWLHKNRTEGCSFKAMNHAAEKGHLEVVKWLYQNTKEGIITEAMKNAIVNGHLKVFEWLNSLKK